MEQLSELQRLERDIAACRRDDARLCAILSDFVAGDALPRILAHCLDSVLKERPWLPEQYGQRSLRLACNAEMSLHVRIFDRSDSLLHTVGMDRVIHVRGSAPVRRDTYEINGPYDPDVFRADAVLRLAGSEPANDRSLVERCREPHVYDYVAHAPFMTVEIAFRPPHDHIWFFDRRSLQALYTAQSEPASSGLVMLAKMAAAVGEERALPMLEHLSRHRIHSVRWAAIQAIGRIDGMRGLKALDRAEQDSHPHIRQAAARALAGYREAR